MMLAHLTARESTEGDWRGVLERAGLRLVGIYTCPGVAEFE
jgi:hypothetical protein